MLRKVTMTGLLVLAVPFLCSCGGKVQGSGSGRQDAAQALSCKSSTPAFSSGDAMVVARCFGGVPAGSQLAGIQPWGPVDAKGLVSKWALTWVAGSNAYLQLIEAESASTTLAPGIGIGTISSCTPGLNNVASSSHVVPDALGRLSGKGVHADSITDIRFLALADCPSLATREGVLVRVRAAAQGATTPSSRWGLRYALDGSFVELCGPCPMSGDDDCVACASGK